MDNQALFVDFMYAVTVGATLPRLDAKVLHWCDPLLWALVLCTDHTNFRRHAIQRFQYSRVA